MTINVSQYDPTRDLVVLQIRQRDQFPRPEPLTSEQLQQHILPGDLSCFWITLAHPFVQVISHGSQFMVRVVGFCWSLLRYVMIFDDIWIWTLKSFKFQIFWISKCWSSFQKCCHKSDTGSQVRGWNLMDLMVPVERWPMLNTSMKWCWQGFMYHIYIHRDRL